MQEKLRQLQQYMLLYGKSFYLVYNSAKSLTLLMMLVLMVQAITPALSIALGNMLLNNVHSGSFTTVLSLVALWGVVFVISNVLTPLNTLLQGQMTDILSFSLTQSLMKKSSQIRSLDCFERSEFYDDVEIIISQASWRPVNLLVFGTSLISNSIALISMLVLLSTFSWLIALFIISALIPQGIIFYRIQQHAFEILVANSNDARKMNNYASSVLNREKIKEIRLYNAYDFFIKQYEKLFNHIIQAVQKNRIKQFVISVIFLLVTAAVSIGSFVFVILGIQQGDFQIGAILIFSGAIIYTVQNISRLVEDSSLLYDTLLYMQKYFHFMQLSDDITQGNTAFKADFTRLHFNHIDFAYPQTEHKALDDVCFSVHRGEKIAIVGENGSGKSTLIKVLLRFYQPKSGDIVFDNHSFTEFNIDDYRNHFAAVFQDFAKFDMTVAENIDFSTARSEEALQRLNHALLSSQLDLPCDLLLGKSFGGTELSGGQWQKLAIARAFYHKGELLILDEPTASIDARSEAQLYDHFLNLSEGKTVFFITHRLSTVKRADKVLLLKQGKVIAFDHHDILLKSCDYYRQLYELQASSYSQ